MRTRKGDVPITILVIGVFAVCSLALLTFFISDFSVSNSFVGLDIMSKMNVQIDEYHYYQSMGVPTDRIETYYRVIEENGRKYFYLEESSKNFLVGEEKVLFSVRYPLPN